MTLYWRADALDDKGESLVVSTVEAFRIPRQLPKPRILAPAPGSIVDLAKIGEVNIVWTPVADANVYQVTLFRALAGYRTKVRSWETSEAFLLWNDFLQLSADTYTLEISALLVDQDKVVIGQSLFGKSAFKLEQSVKVKPVKLELSPEISPN